MTSHDDSHLVAPREIIARALRDDILERRLAPGMRLVESELSERFGVSRVPIREALSKLQSEGFITLVRYRGATVSPTSANDVIQHMQIRRGLEVIAAQLAAENLGGSVAAELRRVVELGRRADLDEDVTGIPPLVLKFHILVAVASGNAQLQMMLEQVLSRVSWVFDQNLKSRSESSWGDHAAIAGAILAGSPIQAGYLMAEHLVKDEQFFYGLPAPITS